MASPRLWTIGYADLTVDELVAKLQKAKVGTLVDVRDLPLSRKKGFSKNGLAASLDAAGIRYVHAKPLGAPKEMRQPFLAGGSYDTFRGEYMAHLSGQGEALDELDTTAKGSKTAIMCLCADASRCHRGIVSEQMEGRGYKVTHL